MKVQRFIMIASGLLMLLLALVGEMGISSAKTMVTPTPYKVNNGTWKLTGSMSIPHAYYTATLLKNGKVLVAGGVDNGDNPSITSAELYR